MNRKYILILIALIICLRITTWNRPVPTYSQIYDKKAQQFEEQGDISQAVQLYHQALTHNPDDPFAHFRLASILEENGKINEALVHYQEVTNTGITEHMYAKAYQTVGVHLYHQDHLTSAAKHLRTALYINDKMFPSYYYLAMADFQLGNQHNLQKPFDYYQILSNVATVDRLAIAPYISQLIDFADKNGIMIVKPK